MATTWSSTGTRSAKVVCDSGTGAAPSAATDGIDLAGVGAVYVFVHADSTRTLSGAGTVDFYLYDDVTQLWAKIPVPGITCTVTVSGVRSQALAGLEVKGGRGRLAAIPNGVTISAGGTTVVMNACELAHGRTAAL